MHGGSGWRGLPPPAVQPVPRTYALRYAATNLNAVAGVAVAVVAAAVVAAAVAAAAVVAAVVQVMWSPLPHTARHLPC